MEWVHRGGFQISMHTPIGVEEDADGSLGFRDGGGQACMDQ
jgi:hypothetical protein